MERRSFLLAAPAAFWGCRHRKGVRFDGYAFVANEEGRAVAVVDLTAFTVARHIHLDSSPSEVIADPVRPSIYVLSRENGTVYEIGMEGLSLRRRIRVAGQAVAMRAEADGQSLWIAARDPRQLIRLPLNSFKPDSRIPLPGEPADLDLSPVEGLAALAFRQSGNVLFVDLKRHKTGAQVSIGDDAGVVRFRRNDGRTLLAAERSSRRLVILEPGTGRLILQLPLAVRPDQFCFKPDGGQLFITGEGLDAVVIVYPHRVPPVAGTMLAGRTPGAMAASDVPGYLFIANPTSNAVTIVEIASQKVLAVVQVGRQPACITITPDNQYALVLNRDSGDMSVIRIGALDAITAPMKRMKSAPLFTMIPVGSKPVAAAVRAV
ncbi:MAG: hypothetical protein NTY38_05030 [Acidobacteria bacterium]|nr:hypothetical protein [Acidobacteriota bacterium]